MGGAESRATIEEQEAVLDLWRERLVRSSPGNDIGQESFVLLDMNISVHTLENELCSSAALDAERDIVVFGGVGTRASSHVRVCIDRGRFQPEFGGETARVHFPLRLAPEPGKNLSTEGHTLRGFPEADQKAQVPGFLAWWSTFQGANDFPTQRPLQPDGFPKVESPLPERRSVVA